MTLGKFEVGQDLGFVNVGKAIDRFEFHHNETVDQKIEPVGVFDDQVFVFNRAGLLFLECNTAKSEFMRQGPLIGRLQ